MHIYEITESLKTIENLIADGEFNPEDLKDTIEALNLEFDSKVDGLCCVRKDLKALAAAVKAEAKALSDRAKSLESQITNIESYLQNQLEANSRKDFKTARNQISFRKSEAVVVDDEMAFVNRACESGDMTFIDVKMTISKSAIKDALESGETVEGARIETRNNIQFK